MFRSSYFFVFVFGHFWPRSYENAKILLNLCLHFARQNRQNRQNKTKENQATRVTKTQKNKRQKYGMNKTIEQLLIKCSF